MLIQSVIDALPRADTHQRDLLLGALTAAPLGSGKGEAIDAVVASQSSTDPWTAAVAAAAVLVLSDVDSTGDEPAPVDLEPRRTAVSVLREAIQQRYADVRELLEIMGPAAAPLLDALIDRMQVAQSNRGFVNEAAWTADQIAPIGVRARRASLALFAMGALLAARPPENVGGPGLVHVLIALGNVGAPAGELTRFVVANAMDLGDIRAGADALVAVRAVVDPADLAILRQRTDAACPMPLPASSLAPTPSHTGPEQSSHCPATQVGVPGKPHAQPPGDMRVVVA